jgi:SAM-dependent methyltransferase
VKIDLGCGPKKQPGFVGLDCIAFDGVDHVLDLTAERWPFDDGIVDEAHASHFVEHLTAMQRVAFFNELYRVLKVGGTAVVITPHWASSRAFGDPTHQWPPFSEFALFYLNREWRSTEAPHTDVKYLPEGFDCDFVCTWGYGVNPALLTRNQEYQQFALSWYKDAAQDLHAHLTKR